MSRRSASSPTRTSYVSTHPHPRLSLSNLRLTRIQGPYGYSNDVSGLMGATLLLAGLVAAAITSPLFDRVLTSHLAITCKILCPLLGGLWLSLIWAGACPLSFPFLFHTLSW